MTDVLVEPLDAAAWLDDATTRFVDTRDAKLYAESHIPGAVNIPDIFTYLSRSTPEGIAEMRRHFESLFGQNGLTADTRLVFVEEGMSSGFGQSSRGYFLAKFLGHDNAYVLHGGMEAWRGADMAVTDEIHPVEASRYQSRPGGENLIVTKDDVLAALGQDDIQILDVRDVDEWIGESSSPYGRDFAPRKGRLPGAKWIEWYRMLKPGQPTRIFKSPLEIRAETATVGLDPKKPVILYCFKGARTSSTFVALKSAGFEQVSTYFGSWNEWSRDDSLPIEEGLPFALQAAE